MHWRGNGTAFIMLDKGADVDVSSLVHVDLGNDQQAYFCWICSIVLRSQKGMRSGISHSGIRLPIAKCSDYFLLSIKITFFPSKRPVASDQPFTNHVQPLKITVIFSSTSCLWLLMIPITDESCKEKNPLSNTLHCQRIHMRECLRLSTVNSAVG